MTQAHPETDRPAQGALVGLVSGDSFGSIPVECPCCGTHGVPLAKAHEALVGTLRLLAQHTEPVSTIDILEIEDPSNRYVSASGMCNRLAALEKLGLAKHEKRGRSKYWTATLPNYV